MLAQFRFACRTHDRGRVSHGAGRGATRGAPMLGLAAETYLWIAMATLLAIPVLGEVPPWTVVPGGTLVLAGVYLAIRGEARMSSLRPPG
jgi:drug/metabolite transporter (DMT)-like permease